MKLEVCQVVPSSANGVQNRSGAKDEEGEITESKDLVSDNRFMHPRGLFCVGFLRGLFCVGFFASAFLRRLFLRGLFGVGFLA